MEEDDILVFGETIKMTKKEFHRFVERCKFMKFPDYAPKIMLDKLDNYKISLGKKYKSDYGALLNWVIGWYNKEGRFLPVTEEDKIPLSIE